MNEVDWFESWFDSHYYHLLYKNRDENEANRFIDTLINKLNPLNESRILDLACGKGRHSFALAEKGYSVTGLDLSENSILTAKKSESENLEFFTHDMRFPFRSNYFDYTFNFFTSFGYFNTEREHINALKTMSVSLKTNGILVIDFLNTFLPELNNTTSEIKTIDNYSFEINKYSTEKHLYKTIKVIDNNSRKLITNFEERVARFGLSEFLHLFKNADLELTEYYGNHEMNEFDLNISPRLILFAKKKIRP